MKTEYKYIKRLNNYTDKELNLMFYKNKIIDNNIKYKILELLKWNKIDIDNNFSELKTLNVINWIGSSKLWYTLIRLLSYLLAWVKYEWHDIMYFVWGTFIDKINADFWLLKHTIYSAFWIFKKIFYLELSPIVKIMFYMVSIISVIFYIWLWLIIFFILIIFGNTAFNFINYKKY